MDDQEIPFGNNFPTDYYDSKRRFGNSGARRQTRHAASHVDFRIDGNAERILEHENSRRGKSRTKPQHCPSCHCQPFHENRRVDVTHKNENVGSKNFEKPEATMTQHFDYGTTKSISMKNRRVGSSSQQRNQNHRPGTSTLHSHNRNTSLNGTFAHRHSLKHENSSRHECTTMRRDSSPRDIVNSDDPETDYHFSHEQMHLRNPCKDCDIFCHSSPGEPHSEPDTDSPQYNRNLVDCDLKRRHSGQGENFDENFHDSNDDKPLIETGSSVARDKWQQYERDQRELEDLREDVKNFVKCKKSKERAVDGKDDIEDVSEVTLEKIEHLVSKLPVPTKRGSAKIGMTLKGRDKVIKAPKSRIRSSKIDPRRTCDSCEGIDKTATRNQELRRKLESELQDIELEDFKRKDEGENDEDEDEEEENLELENEEKRGDEIESETEEEARQLVEEKDVELERITRNLKKSWSSCRRDCQNFRCTGKIRKNQCGKNSKNGNPSQGETKLSQDFCERTKLSCNAMTTNRQDIKDLVDDETLITEEKSDFRKNRANETREKMFERASSILDSGMRRKNDNNCDKGTSKTRIFIDEMIDGGLSREEKLENSDTLRDVKKDLPQEKIDAAEGISSKCAINGHGDEKISRDDCFCHTLTRPREIFSIVKSVKNDIQHLDEAKRDDCFCQKIVKMLADDPNSQNYVKKLKNRRWTYLNSIQNDLGKLYNVERILDACSPERNRLSIIDCPIDADFGKGRKKYLAKSGK